MINIVGAGLAGLSAAISLAEQGVGCNLISMQPSERAQSVLAEGGINAALDTMGENDKPEEHFADTMRGGVELADPNAVKGLTSHAPEIVRWLVKLGVPLQMKDGKVMLRNFGGQKKKRTAFAKSSTGKIIMSGLIDEARKHEAAGRIVRFSHHEVLEVCIENRRCMGLKMRDTYTDEVYFCPGSVILAMGGLNGIFPEYTTGTVQNTGDLAAELFASGVEMANLEFIQYHPTTVCIPGKRMLVSEAARGEGGRLYILRNGKPWYFMEELYPELGNLMPRDVVSREIANVRAREDCEAPVYLDMTGLSKEIWNTKLSDMREEIITYLAIDPVKQPVAIQPSIHFFMGGIAVDERHGTNIHGLYAAGECACQYHGANRLGGNSMLAALYGGNVAAHTAASEVAQEDRKNVSLGILSDEEKKRRQVSADAAKRLRDILLSGLGIIRSGEQMRCALRDLDEWLGQASLSAVERERGLLGQAMLLSAIARCESRGAHYRTDYPRRDDEHFQKTTTAAYREGEIKVEFQEIPVRRAAHDDSA